MKKNIVIGIMAGLAIVFLYLWQATDMKLNSHKKKVAQLAETIASQMKTGQENFEWKMFLERRGFETLLKKYFEVADWDKQAEIELEIQKRLLNYPRDIYVAEPREILIKKLLKSFFGEDLLAPFVKEAREVIRIYEEERGKKWK